MIACHLDRSATLRRELAGLPQQKTLGQMMRAIDGLSASFNVMLDLSKLDAGVIAPKPQPIMLSRLFGALQDQFALAARNIPMIDVLPIQGINVYDILRRKKLVLTKAAVEALEARFK